MQAIHERIRKLSERTTDRGFTENEAMVAAGMLAKMLSEHGLSMSDIEIKERDDCETGEIETGRKRDHEIVYCVAAIAAFTDCKAWRSKRHSGNVHSFFGFPEDVAAAKWLYDATYNAMIAESAKFTRANGGGRRAAHSFRMGIAKRVSERLREIKRAQETETISTTGRALVPVKTAAVSEQFASLNLNLRRGSSGGRYSDGSAYNAGKAAGERVNFNRPIGRATAGYLT